MMNPQSPISNLQSCEWLETDGLGGFASGAATGIRTRRYHALLLTATTPPGGRLVLVNGFDAWLETPNGRQYLTRQRYAPDVTAPDDAAKIVEFSNDPWPRWVFETNDGVQVELELCVTHGTPLTALRWRLLTPRKNVWLFVRPFLSGRDYHSLHHENPAFCFDAALEGERVTWRPYQGVPGILALSNGSYAHQPDWYRNFLYDEEQTRGLDCTEDLATPGFFAFDLSLPEAVLLLTTTDSDAMSRKRDLSTVKFAQAVRANEKLRRAEFPSRLHRSADDYIVSGRHGKTVIAGYPWFTDWGRDTFIAMRGLCIASGRLTDAREILLGWANSVSQGMLPNLFPDHSVLPEYNSVDSALWYVIAVHELMEACHGNCGILSARDKRLLQDAVEAILEGYSSGTRFDIRMDVDGLLACGVPGVQLTWMDAKVGDWVVTPRIGKPVEVQALWLNALKVASKFSPGWEKHFDHGLKSFREKFWSSGAGCLFDVIDVDHETGKVDAAFRPNQIFAIGGLPFQLFDGERAKQVVAAVEEKLLAPLGLRSLASNEADYKSHYQGGVRERDGAYHQGTVWPWLTGPFVEAWVRVGGSSAAAKKEARAKFLAPFLTHLDEAGLGHVSEIADAEAPHTPRGCPFQAWSLGELLRLDQAVLTNSNPPHKRATELAVA